MDTFTYIAAALGGLLASCLLVVAIQVILIRSLWIKMVSNHTVNVMVDTLNITVGPETDE